MKRGRGSYDEDGDAMCEVELGNLEHQTDSAMLFRLLGAKGGQKVWIPKAVIAAKERDPRHGTWVLRIPEKMALEKGLI